MSEGSPRRAVCRPQKPQALVNVTHSRGNHTYKAGFEVAQ
jgi:hypothetical protein